jgi:hypothetical protein
LPTIFCRLQIFFWDILFFFLCMSFIILFVPFLAVLVFSACLCAPGSKNSVCFTCLLPDCSPVKKRKTKLHSMIVSICAHSI